MVRSSSLQKADGSSPTSTSSPWTRLWSPTLDQPMYAIASLKAYRLARQNEGRHQ